MDELDVELERFTPGAVSQALKRLGRKGSGALLVTSGLRDHRLVVEPGRVSLETAGLELIGDEEADLIRAFLCCLFWEEPSYFLDLAGGPIMSAAAIRVDAEPREVLSQIGQGFTELLELRERVPGLDVLVAVRGEPPPPEVDTPSANLFRVLERSPGGGFLLSAAEDAKLDAIDAAWAVSDLLDAGQATVKQAPPSTAQRRLKASEAVIHDGLVPAVRAHHVASALQRSDPKRAAHLFQEAGDGFLIAAKPEMALVEYGACLQAIPDHPLALEGKIRALQGLGRSGEATSLHETLAALYGGWALPRRTREHLEALPTRTPEQQELLLNCMLLEKDFAAAEGLARGLLPSLDLAGRQAVVARFGESGASPADVDAVARLAGLQRMRPVRRLCLALAGLALLAAGAFGLEAAARQRFAMAAVQTRAAAERGDFTDLAAPWQELAGYAQQAGGVPFSCLAEVPPLLVELDRLTQDAELVGTAPRQAPFAWADPARYPDVRVADRELEALGAAAKSAALQAKVAAAREALAGYRAEVAAAVDELAKIAHRGAALRRGKALLERYPNSLDLLAGREVSLQVEVLPESDATTVDWSVDGEGRRAGASGRGTYELRLPLRPDAEGVLSVRQPGHVPQTLTLRLAELIDPELHLDLVAWGKVDFERLNRPRGADVQGLVVGETFTGVHDLGFPLDQLTRAPARAGLEFLCERLAPGQRLLVEVVNSIRPGGALYLERFNLWLEVGGRVGSAYKVDLSRKPVLPGVRRDVRGGHSEGRSLEPLEQLRGIERVRDALLFVVAEMQREATR